MCRSQRLLCALSIAFLFFAISTRFVSAHFRGERSADAAIGSGIVRSGQYVASALQDWGGIWGGWNGLR